AMVFRSCAIGFYRSRHALWHFPGRILRFGRIEFPCSNERIVLTSRDSSKNKTEYDAEQYKTSFHVFSLGKQVGVTACGAKPNVSVCMSQANATGPQRPAAYPHPSSSQKS